MDSRSPSNLSPEIIESLAISIASAIGNQPAMLANTFLANLVQNQNLLQQNAVAAQQALNQIELAVIGKSVNTVLDLSPAEAEAIEHHGFEQQLAELRALARDLKTNQPRP